VHVLDVTQVLFVPELKSNLLSVSQLRRRAYRWTSTREGAPSNLEGETLARATLVDRLYVLSPLPPTTILSPPAPAHLVNMVQGGAESLWHERMGHPGTQALERVLKGDIVRGLPKGLQAPNQVCQGCLQGKQARKPFPGAARKTSQPLALVHADVCGPMHVPTVGGGRYILMVVDDASRHKSVYVLQKKSEAAGRIKHYKASMEARLGHEVKELRPTGPRIPQQGPHGVPGGAWDHPQLERAIHAATERCRAERANRTLLEALRSMLYGRRVRLGLWGRLLLLPPL